MRPWGSLRGDVGDPPQLTWPLTALTTDHMDWPGDWGMAVRPKTRPLDQVDCRRLARDPPVGLMWTGPRCRCFFSLAESFFALARGLGPKGDDWSLLWRALGRNSAPYPRLMLVRSGGQGGALQVVAGFWVIRGPAGGRLFAPGPPQEDLEGGPGPHRMWRAVPGLVHRGPFARGLSALLTGLLQNVAKFYKGALPTGRHAYRGESQKPFMQRIY